MGTVISNETTSFYFHISTVRFVSPCPNHRGRVVYRHANDSRRTPI